MPSTYAHYCFGQKVYNNLDTEVKQLIDRHHPLFLSGLQGPDLLFYYRPFTDNPVTSLAHEVHRKTAKEFFDRARNQLAKSQDQEAGIVYLLGFFCHFMLDSECHVLVKEVTGSDEGAHNRLEKELDRTLMLNDNLDPLSYRTSELVFIRPRDLALIASFYTDVIAEQIKIAYKDMKIFLDLIVTPGRLKYEIVSYAFRLFWGKRKFESLIINHEPISEYVELSSDLSDLLSQAVLPTAELAGELYRLLCEGKEGIATDALRNRLDRTF